VRSRAIVFGYAGILAAGFGYLLAQVPVQVSDCVANIVRASTSSWGKLLEDELATKAFLRPLIHAQTKAVLAIAGGWEFEVFRAIHIVQVAAAFLLFVRLLRVRTGVEAVGAVVAVTAFCGMHTFGGVLHEAYPINNPLTVALCVLVAVNIATEPRSRWWTDGIATAALLLAAGTIETGLLVWVAVVSAAVAGCRGVSRAGLTVLTCIVAAYFATRFVILDVGSPDILERSSGFMFERLEPEQLRAQFEGNPLPFYAYNVVSSAGTVLFAEPRGGVLTLGQALHGGDEIRPWMIVNVASSTATTGLLLWFAFVSRWRGGAGAWSHGQRLLVVAAAVLCANAVISYPYTKDQIMIVGGMAVAAAVGPAVAAAIASAPRSALVRAGTALLLAVIAASWGFRALGLQHLLAHTAFTTRNDWAAVDPGRAVGPYAHDLELVSIISSLRRRALQRGTSNPQLAFGRSPERWFDHTIR
jgi:hypothetical protein